MSKHMTFSRQVKDELCRQPEKPDCCALAELAVALVGAGRFRDDQVTIATAHAPYAHRLISQMSDRFGFSGQIRQGLELLTLTFAGRESMRKLMEALSFAVGFDPSTGSLSAQAFRSDCCLRSALRGFFLSCGSIAEPQSAYHLELSVRQQAAARLAVRLLARVDIRGNVLERNGYHVVYLKEGQYIADFLLQTGAHESLMEFESLRVEKEMRNSVNRVVNCDNANSQRIANTSARQLELIRSLRDSRHLGRLPAELQAAAQARLENPDLSLRELGELMDPPIGKSGMNHRLKKLENLAASHSSRQAPMDPAVPDERRRPAGSDRP